MFEIQVFSKCLLCCFTYIYLVLIFIVDQIYYGEGDVIYIYVKQM
jgi:hypothetical protein